MDSAKIAEKRLKDIKVCGSEISLFGEIDNRGKTLFIESDYPLEIKDETTIKVDDQIFALKPHFVFVGIKNGKHNGTGYCFFSDGVAKNKINNSIHVKEIFSSVKDYFLN
jgi:hypothetical protein